LTIKFELIHGSKDKRGMEIGMTIKAPFLHRFSLVCMQIHPSIQLHMSTAVSTAFLKFAEGRKAKREYKKNPIYLDYLQLKIHQRAKETPKITARARATITTTSALRIAA
jgi:hypothetical protein